jgi:gliding motility-associated-like protein
MYHTAIAQLCAGSLGDPLVNITFGAGSNPGQALAAAATNYQFSNADCPDDGSYTVRNNTVNCFSSSWHTLNTDHTGNNSGYFMLVNASFNPGAFYVDTVRGLCGNTTFEFAAWIVNVLKPSSCNSNGIQPNLTFTIERTDGTILQTYNTNAIASQASPQWTQYGFFFNTPLGVSDVVLRIVNNSQGGCGNDLALDDITFRPCGPQLAVAIDGQNTSNITACEGVARSFTFRTAVSPGFNSPVFQWQQSTDGTNWADISGANALLFTANFPANTAPGKYLYRMSAAEQGNLGSAKCRVASAPLSVEVQPLPVTTVNITTPACEGESITLTATGGGSYQWAGNGIASTVNPLTIGNIQLGNAGKILVEVTNNGCSKKDSAILTVFPKPVATVSIADTGICSGNTIQLSAGGGGSYSWQPALGLSADDIANPVASPAATTTYNVIVANNDGCSDTTTVTVTLVEKPLADAGPDKTILAGSSVVLSASVSGQDVSFAWSPAGQLNDATALQPLASPTADIDYVLTATSNAGCGIDRDTVHVFVFKDIYVPTAFSPDGNNINDTWNIPALNAFPSFELSLYNRHGQLVYQNRNSFRPWDGTYKGEPQPAAVYVYVINLGRGLPVKKGSVLLIR